MIINSIIITKIDSQQEQICLNFSFLKKILRIKKDDKSSLIYNM